MTDKSRHERARALLAYLHTDGFTIGGADEHGRLALEASEDAAWPPSRAIRMAITDLETEMREVVQRDIARLIVATRFRAWQERYTTEESALEQVRETWPKHAALACAIHAPELLRVAFVAAAELCDFTGDVGPIEAAAALIETGVEWGPDAVRELADFLEERWKAQGHGGPAEGGAWNELRRALRVPRLWAMTRRRPAQAEPEPAGQR